MNGLILKKVYQNKKLNNPYGYGERMIDNRDTIAINFYWYKNLTIECFKCGATDSLNEISDGYDSVVCWDCLNMSLKELNCSSDFQTNDFNKKVTSCKSFPRTDWK